jgi:hypothetical protein
VLELDVVPQPRAQPAAEQVRLRGRAGDADPLHVRDPGPERGEACAPAAGARPRDVGRGGVREDVREARVAARDAGPLGRVDDQAVGELDELLELGRAERRLAAPAQEDGEVGDEQRLDDARRGRGRRPVQAQLDHLGADRPLDPRGLDALERGPGVDPAAVAVRLRDEEQRPRRVQLRHAFEGRPGPVEPVRRHPGDVRHHARPQVRRRARLGDAVAEAGQRPRDVADRDVLARPGLAQCLRHDRPSRWRSSSAARGPHVPAA